MKSQTEPKPRMVAVIGGGIGGLAASIALRNVGLTTQVFERAPRFAEVGVSVGLTPNGMTALDMLGDGIGEAVRTRGRALSPQAVFPIRTATGRTIGSSRYGELQRRHGAPFVAIRRVELHRVLLDAHGPAGLHPGAELTDLHDDGDGVTAQFADGTDSRFDLLIGADGVRSTVRVTLFGPEPPRYVAGSLRGIARGLQLPDDLAEASLTIGPDVSVFSLPLGSDDLHWTAVVKSVDEGAWPRDARQARAQLLALVGDWASPVPDLINTSDPSIMVAREILDRPPLTGWSHNRVTLLGDAAHPMNNSPGQGANTAIEDAVVLACALGATPDPVEALCVYERERIPRTTRIVLKCAEVSEGSRARVESNSQDDDAEFMDWLYGYSPAGQADPLWS